MLRESSPGPGRACSDLRPRNVPTPPGPESAERKAFFDVPFDVETVLEDLVREASVKYLGIEGWRTGLVFKLKLDCKCWLNCACCAACVGGCLSISKEVLGVAAAEFEKGEAVFDCDFLLAGGK